MNDTCGCCEGITQLTPKRIANRPGLDTLAYRVGTHAAFLETMKARLSTFCLGSEEECKQGNGPYPLRSLTTRAEDDPSIALLDAWATVADVLTFYQERIANEGYLPTATERRSILELARLVGYTLRPGVASTVYLAYTLDPNSKDLVSIPVGTRAQSVPGPGELPQSFETTDPLDARAAWNVLKPRMTRPQIRKTIENGPADSTKPAEPRVYLKGTSTNLTQNDPLLIDFGADRVLYRATDIQPDTVNDRTLVMLQRWTPAPQTHGVTVSPEDITMQTKRQLGSILARYLGEEADKLTFSRNIKIFKDVSATLASLQEQLAEDVPFPKMIAHLDNETLPSLARASGIAEQRESYAVLRPWLNNMIEELSNVSTSARAVRAEASAREFTSDASSLAPAPLAKRRNGNGGQVGSGTDNVFEKSEVFTGLAAPASIPPRNALALERKTSTAFQAKADNNLQMVGTFRSDLREALPTVVANTKVTPDVAMKVYALRVKAALFGHNAPKQTTYDTNGHIKLQKDWLEWTAAEMCLAEDITPVNASAPDSESSVVYLDNSYDKILPESWVVVDTGAVDTSKLSAVQVSQPPPLIVKARNPKTDISRAEYGIAGKSTRIELGNPQDSSLVPWIRISCQPSYVNSSASETTTNDYQVIRRTAIYAQSEELPLAEEPIDDPICGSDDASDPNAYIELDGVYSELQAGRWLIVSGERTDIQVPDPNNTSRSVSVTGVKSSELVMLSEVVQRIAEADQEAQAYGYYGYGPQPVRGERTHTYIRLAKKLAYCYKRDAVTIYGNVVRATHGETRNEVLGSGDGSKAFQTFALKQSPLTYVSSPKPAGAESTLHVRVNDVEWHETDNLSELGPNDRKFITRTSDDDKTTVIFGNGRQGARPPTGIENIKSVYRNGIGKAGNVKAEQISLLVSRPLGVKGVINPLRASGGADKESGDLARKNAPLAVRALDRLVSTQDYADFARTFAGIGKASAAHLSDGRRQLVHVTIAGADDIPIDKSSDLYHNLVKALRDYGDPYQPIQVELRELMLIVISANVRIESDYQWESVVTNIRIKLLDTFSFERRELGQDVLLSEVISAIQSVDGVAYVDVDLLRGVPEKKADEANPDQRRLLTPAEIAAQINQPLQDALGNPIPEPLSRIVVNLAGPAGGPIHPAQLAFLSPDVEATLILNEVKS